MSKAKRAIPIGGDPCPPKLRRSPAYASGPIERLRFVLRSLRLRKGG